MLPNDMKVNWISAEDLGRLAVEVLDHQNLPAAGFVFDVGDSEGLAGDDMVGQFALPSSAIPSTTVRPLSINSSGGSTPRSESLPEPKLPDKCTTTLSTRTFCLSPICSRYIRKSRPASQRWINEPAPVPWSTFASPESSEREQNKGGRVQIMPELNQELQLLIDRSAITDLLNRYGRAVDDKDWDTWEECFTDDALVEFPFDHHEGKSGLGAWGEAALAPFEATHHMSSNFNIIPEGHTAAARSNLLAVHVMRRDEPGAHFDVGGFYDWILRWTDVGWKIQSVQLTILWTAGADATGLTGEDPG